MRIQHNIPAMNAYRHYTNNTSALQKNLEKLSSGYKINKAGDDAAGLAVSEKMRAQITGLQVAQKNAKDGISLVQTAEGAMNEVHDMLNRMYELAELSSNGTYDDEVDRANYQKEIESLTSEIDRIAESTNFNGIDLLDGSLQTKGAKGASAIKIEGVNSSKSAGVKGAYDSGDMVANAAGLKWGSTAGKLSVGDEYTFTVTMEGGESYAAHFTVKEDTPGVFSIVGDGGTSIAVKTPATNGSIQIDGTTPSEDLADAIRQELEKTDLAKEYTIGTDSGKLTFSALAEGTQVRAITAMDEAGSIGGSPAAPTTLKVSQHVTTTALDEGREIMADDITLYDGTNYDDAVFTINGKKFVVMTGNDTAADVAAANYMKATEGLDSDVTILISDDDHNKGLKSTDKNFQQNIAKIAAVTGLNVTQNYDKNTQACDGANGIRLTAGKNSVTGGLTLQIGDTSDDFNKLTVGINDMHAKAMGIKDIDVSTQEGASEAMKKIKSAINYVSSTRGDLGALQNRLDHAINNLSVAEENITDAESTIRDVDVAKEMMAYTKNNILIQSAQAMLAQANQLPQGVLQLLQ